MGWGTETERLVPRCEECGHPAVLAVLTQTTHTILPLYGQEAPEVSGHATRRLLCMDCAVPVAFARSAGVTDVLEGRATSAVVRIRR